MAQDVTQHAMYEVSRRDAVLGGLCAACGLVLSACGARRTNSLPDPVWEQARVTPRPSNIGSSSIGSSGSTVYYPPVSQPAPQGSQQVAIASSIRFMPRSAWTKASPKWNLSKPMNGVSKITVHHDALNTDGNRGTGFAVDRLNRIRKAHLDRGSTWVDIGYHYVIDPDGVVWEGRPLSIEGAHVSATNDHNLGIMCMGNFDQQRPTQAQLASLDTFIAEQMRAHRVPMSRVYTHLELKKTECPGDALQNYMAKSRRNGRLASLA